MKHFGSRKKRGFTIGEVVLSSFVMTMGIASILGLINFSFQSSREAEDIIVASELAQEGVELARNIRDNALVDKIATGSSADVLAAFRNGANNRCIIDYNDSTFSCGNNINLLLSLNNGLYEHGAGGQGKYYRLLKTSKAGGGDTVQVLSFVTWQNPGANFGNGPASSCTLANKCVYTEVFLTKWK